MKKITKFIVMILVIATMLLTVVSCNKKKGELTVKEDAMPQLVHVLGEELDLSAGTLVYSKGKKSEEIAMNADGVEISGYNKDQLGEQTVTLTYEGASTTITVTVVERMQVVDFVADYLVGDEFDKSKGRLRITQNNGTSYTVNLNNAYVSIEGFDSSNVGTGKTLTAKYTGSSETYTATFAVNVHGVDSITLQAPNKKAYSSHDKNLVLDGGRIVLSGNNGTLTREIKLTDPSVSVSGFNPGAANSDSESITQTIYVTYGGVNYPYEIKITYTSVSMFNDNAHKFKEFDWDGEEAPVISEELGEFALDLMEMYVELATADAVLISHEDLLNVARAAVYYGYTKWFEDILTFEGAFNYGYDENYQSYSIFVTCETYEDVVAAIAALKVEDRDLYRMYKHLVKICEIESIYDEVVALIPTSIIGDTGFTSLIPMFEHMVKMHDVYLPMIKIDWQTLGYAEYEDEIIEIYDAILDAGYIDSANSWIYEQVTYWYDSDNLIKTFDAFYEYYFANEDEEALANLAKVTLHSDFLEFVIKLDTLMTTLDSVDNGDILDNTEFFHDYYAFVDYAAEFVANGDTMVKYIYAELPVNVLFGYDETDDIYISTLVDYLYYGYAQITSSLIDIPAFDNLMEDYLAAFLIAKEKDEYLTDVNFAKHVEGMMSHYLELSSTEQYLFFGAIMTNYYWRADLLLAFDPAVGEERYLASFVNFITEYYDSIFAADENAKAAYKHLLVANEIYTKKYDEMFQTEDWTVAFAEEMTAFATAYEAITDKDYFNCYFGALRTYCGDISARIARDPLDVPAEWKEVFDELKVAIKAMDDSSYIIEAGSSDSENYYFYNVFLAAYERAQKLVNQILTSGDDEIIDLYYHELIYVLNIQYDDGTSDTYIHSYEYAFSGLRGYYILYRIYTAGSAEAYESFGFPEFFDLVYDLIIPCFNGIIYTDNGIDITHDQFVAIMNAYAGLSPEAKAYHLLMEGGVYSTYISAIAKYLNETADYSDNVEDLIININQLEYAQSFYYYYSIMADLESAAVQSEIKRSLDDIKAVYEALVELYESLNADEIAEFAPFQAIYDQYVAEIEALLPQLNA